MSFERSQKYGHITTRDHYQEKTPQAPRIDDATVQTLKIDVTSIKYDFHH